MARAQNPLRHGMTMDNGLQFHHVGYVVASIQDAAGAFARSLALDWSGEIVHDPLQRVRVSFFYPQQPGNAVVELVEPAADDSPVKRTLERGGGLHHLCYEVNCLDSQLEWCRSNGDLVVRAPVPAVAFQGRRIAWVYTKTKLLVEYLERCPK